MRKIISKEEEAKKAKKNQLILGVFLIFIMFVSIIGYSLNTGTKTSEQSITYNNFKFVKNGNVWETKIGEFTFSFMYNPKETPKINTSLNYLNTYQGKPLYFSAEVADSEIYRNLLGDNQIVQRMQYACLEKEKCDEDLPVKTCEDNFIIIKKGESDIIRQEKNCVFIIGKEENLTKLTDSFLFKILGIQ